MLIAGLIFFLSLITIRPQAFVPGLVGTRLVFYSMAALLAAWIASPCPKKLVQTVQDKFVCLFFIAIVISTISVGWMYYSVVTFLDTCKIALIYFFIVTVVSDKSALKTTTWAFVFLLTIVAVFCILQHFGIDLQGQGRIWSPMKNSWQPMGVGIFHNPNDIAYTVIFVVPFYLSGVVSSKGVRRACFIALLTLSLYTIYLTKSRGGYLAAFSCLVCWVFMYTENSRLRRLIIPLAFALLICAFLAKTHGYRDDSSAMGRIDAWGAGMHMLKAHPIIGVGKGQWFEYHHIDSHNSFVRAGAELGLFGLYAFIGVLFYSIKSLYNLKNIDSYLNLYRISFLSYLTAYAVGSMFSTRTYDIIILVAVALTSSLQRLATSEDATAALMVHQSQPRLINKQVALLTISCVVVWHLFLVNVWHRFM